MSTNKIIVYSFLIFFTIALSGTLPKKDTSYKPEVGIRFSRKNLRKINKVKRDPFRYKEKQRKILPKTIRLSDVAIKGIIWDDKNPSAAISINGQKTIFVNEGDKINHMRILQIERDRIVINEYGRRTIKFK
jgi:type II secretory pathway component PulC